MELDYLEDIKEDVDDMINSMIDHNYGFKVGVNRVIFENDLYMSDEKPIERDCHYNAIGAYAIETNNINNLDIGIINEIKRSLDIIKSGIYNDSFTEEDKKYINDDVFLIEKYNMF